MSFILDALRKAEVSRQGLSERALAAPLPVSSPEPVARAWLWPALGLSVVTAVVTAWLLRGDPEPTPVQSTIATARNQQPARAVAVETEVEPPRREVRRLALEATPPPPASAVSGTANISAAASKLAPIATSGPVKPGRVEVRDLLAEEIDVPAVQADQRAARPGTVGDDSQPGRTGDTQTMRQVMIQGADVPEMRLDLLIYREVPAERVVYINMRKYREGQQTAEDAYVEAITPEGVQLRYGGRSFILTPP